MSADEKNELSITGRMHFDVRASSLDEGDISTNPGTEYDTDGKSLNSTGEYEMRRARLGIKGKLDGIWKYDVVLNGIGKGNTLDTAALTFAPNKTFNIVGGRFKQAFNLEGLTSSNDIDLMERSFINQFSPHKKLGLGITGEPTKGMTYMFTKYQEGWVDTDRSNENNYSGRLTYDFASANKIKGSIFHMGLSGFSEDYSQTPTTSSNGVAGGGVCSTADGTTTCTASYGTTHARVLGLKSAGRGYSPLFAFDLQGANLTGGGASEKAKANVAVDSKMYGLEGILAKGPFKLQAEYAKGDYEASSYNGSNLGSGSNGGFDISSFYLMGSWVMTGESYADAYKGGKMGGLKVKTPFDFETGKGIGLWEVVARGERYKVDNMSMFQPNAAGSGSADFDESRVRGTVSGCGAVTDTYKSSATSNFLEGCSSTANTYTVGVNWLANENVKIKAAYAQTNFGNGVKAPDIANTKEFDDERLFSMRMQYMF
jgi:phosphate-selective porin OprO/OprP